MPPPEPAGRIIESRSLTVSPGEIDFFERYGRTKRGPSGVTAWPALTKPERIVPSIFPNLGMALPTSVEIEWSWPPRPGRYEATLALLPASRQRRSNEITYDVVLQRDDADHARSRTTMRIPETLPQPQAAVPEPSELSSLLADSRLLPHQRSWNRTITKTEAFDYCGIAGDPLVGLDQFAWAPLPRRPQAILPASLLTSLVLQAAGCPSSGSIRVWYLRPTLTGMAITWWMDRMLDSYRIGARCVGRCDEHLFAIVQPTRASK
jgi:hypothetical protein